jgi:hypothetical protein
MIALCLSVVAASAAGVERQWPLAAQLDGANINPTSVVSPPPMPRSASPPPMPLPVPGSEPCKNWTGLPEKVEPMKCGMLLHVSAHYRRAHHGAGIGHSKAIA